MILNYNQIIIEKVEIKNKETILEIIDYKKNLGKLKIFFHLIKFRSYLNEIIIIMKF